MNIEAALILRANSLNSAFLCDILYARITHSGKVFYKLDEQKILVFAITHINFYIIRNTAYMKLQIEQMVIELYTFTFTKSNIIRYKMKFKLYVFYLPVRVEKVAVSKKLPAKQRSLEPRMIQYQDSQTGT